MPQRGVFAADLAGEQEHQRRPPSCDGAAGAEHREQIILGAQDPLGGEELLHAQVIKGGTVARPRQQEAGAGQQFLTLRHRPDRAAFVVRIIVGEGPQDAVDLEITDLGRRALARRLLVADMHAVGDHLEPGPRRLPLPHLVAEAVEQHVVHDPPVELVAVLRQPTAAVPEDAQCCQHHRVLGERPKVVPLAEGRDQSVGLFRFAERMEPAGDKQVLQRLRQRFQRRLRQAELAQTVFVEAVGAAGQQHPVAGLQPDG